MVRAGRDHERSRERGPERERGGEREREREPINDGHGPSRGGPSYYSGSYQYHDPEGHGEGVDFHGREGRTWREVMDSLTCQHGVRPGGALLVFAALAIMGTCFGLGTLVGRGGSRTTPIVLGSYTPEDVRAHFTAFHFTDVHLEPFFSPRLAEKGVCRDPACCAAERCTPFEYGTNATPALGCDPPVRLLTDSLTAMKGIDSKAAYIFYTGDMAAHHLCTEAMVLTTQTEFLRRVREHLPHTPFFFAVGNIDLWPNNRNSPESFVKMYEVLEKECPQCAMFQKKYADKNEETFKEGGYYMYRDSSRAIRVLVMNSGLWSPHYNNDAIQKSVIDGHMDWLGEQLEDAHWSKEKVVILGHIPPGHVRHVNDWTDNYLERYMSLCTHHKETILAQFYGHHSKEYIRSFSEDVGVLVSSGMTPLGGGNLQAPGTKDAANPTFRYATFTRDKLYDTWSFFMDLSSGASERSLATKDEPRLDRPLIETRHSAKFNAAVRAAADHGFRFMYSFREAYLVPDVSARSIHMASRRILTDSKFQATYQMYLNGLHSDLRLLACDVHTTAYNSESQQQCVDRLCVFDMTADSPCKEH